MTIDQKALDEAVDAFVDNTGGFGMDDDVRAVTDIITTYLAALPASDHAGLVERLRAATMTFDWADLPDDALIPAVPLLRQAATALSAGVSDV